MKGVPVFFKNVQEKRIFSTTWALSLPNCFAAVRLASIMRPDRSKVKIADGGKVVEIGIALCGLFIELDLAPAQLVVLHLELDLVNPQFMDKYIRIFRRNLIVRAHLRPQSFFGFPPQSVVTASVFHKNSLRPGIVVVPASDVFLGRPPQFLFGRKKVRSVQMDSL